MTHSNHKLNHIIHNIGRINIVFHSSKLCHLKLKKYNFGFGIRKFKKKTT